MLARVIHNRLPIEPAAWAGTTAPKGSAMPREDERFDEREDYGRRDDVDVRRSPPSGMDGFFLNTNMFVLVLFGFCCGLIALIVGIVGLAVCKDPDAKQRALVVTIIAAIMSVLNVLAGISQMAANPALR
jgi:hypothetical protein